MSRRVLNITHLSLHPFNIKPLNVSTANWCQTWLNAFLWEMSSLFRLSLNRNVNVASWWSHSHTCDLPGSIYVRWTEGETWSDTVQKCTALKGFLFVENIPWNNFQIIISWDNTYMADLNGRVDRYFYGIMIKNRNIYKVCIVVKHFLGRWVCAWGM